MESNMAKSPKSSKKLSDIIADLIGNGKRKKLEKAFRDDPIIMKHIDAYDKAHDRWMSAHQRMMDSIDRICNKNDCDTNID